MKYLCKLCIGEHQRGDVRYYILLLTIMYVMLGFMNVGLGYVTSIAFSVNYLWPSTLFVCYIYNYYKYKDIEKNVTLIKRIVLFLFAILTGAMNESFSVGLSAALFIYYLIHTHRTRFKGIVALLTIGLWIGTTICCVNPANIGRFMGSNDSNLIRELSLRILWLGSNIELLVPIFSVIILIIITNIRNMQLVKELKNKYMELIVAIVCTFLFLVAIGLKGNMQMFISCTLLSIILTYKLLERILDNRLKIKKM